MQCTYHCEEIWRLGTSCTPFGQPCILGTIRRLLCRAVRHNAFRTCQHHARVTWLGILRHTSHRASTYDLGTQRKHLLRASMRGTKLCPCGTHEQLRRSGCKSQHRLAQRQGAGTHRRIVHRRGTSNLGMQRKHLLRASMRGTKLCPCGTHEQLRRSGCKSQHRLAQRQGAGTHRRIVHRGGTSNLGIARTRTAQNYNDGTRLF